MMKPIPNFPGYFADEQGNIYSIKTSHPGFFRDKPILLKACHHKGGRKSTHISERGIIKPISNAVLVLETFVSPRPKGMLACHGIRGCQDDSLDNVYWATQSQNNGIDETRDGTDQNGEKSYAHKITEKDVRFIRTHYSPGGINGLTQKRLADMFQLNQGTISKIILRKKWKHI